MTSGVAVTAKWQAIPGRLTRISKGRSGVWGVNSGGNIYKLNSNGIESIINLSNEIIYEQTTYAANYRKLTTKYPYLSL